MMDIPVCESCKQIIEPNDDAIEFCTGKMRYHASGDMSVTGTVVFYHTSCAPIDL